MNLSIVSLRARPARRFLVSTLGIGVAVALLASAPSSALASEADFYKGKTFTIVVGYAPGGGYDAYARLMGSHIRKHIPGNPTVVVRNMPGASSIRSANYIYSQAAKDGSVIGMFASSAAFAPLLGTKAARFKADKFTWIGNLDQATGTCSVWHTSGIKNFQDVLTKPAIFGGSTPAGLGSQYARSMNTVFGTQIRIIHGYAGATSVLLAMQRGEVQGGCGFPLASLESVRRDDYEAHRLIPIVQFALKSPKLKSVPHVMDFARTEEDKRVFNLIYNRDILGRPVAAPPGLSAERTKTLRTAFSAMTGDEAFRKAAKTRFLALAPQSGEEVERFIGTIASYSPQTVEKALKALAVGKVQKVKLKSLEGVIKSVGKGRFDVTDAKGKKTRIRVSGRRTSVMIKGKKANRKALKSGMKCSLRYLGEGDFAKTLACD